ncbi:hypothetical protein [Falsibacillus pallidus]|uniref:Uncharacterized protein n=1 Tax=Falsibacillus pallidus TaxID=493781 RepID=A0A370G2C0_9BACI|nr:hypothetical protein [Falsibacillus pallidus]RDI38017.1 hypothetical protein DFR59_11929 [Falsibacillus pallidus]
MKNKKILVVLGILLLIIIPYKLNTKVYGNDEESILKVVRSIEGYDYQSIEILAIKDIKNERVVPLLLNNNPGFIQFTKNKRGNYEWRHIEKRENQSLASFPIYLNGKESPNRKLLFVTNKDNEVAKMELDVNGQFFHKVFNIHENSVAWIDLPKQKSIEFKYKYYDKSGNLIK